MQNRPSITVIYGGVGPEREVSLITGQAVLEGLRERWDVVDLRLDQAALPEGLKAQETLVFVGLHGLFGEDGRFQRLLENAGIHYVGSDALSSYLCMQKPISKALAAARGLKVLPEVVFQKPFYTPEAQSVIKKLGEAVILKPVDGGSSTGITMCEGPESLEAALQAAGSGHWMLEPRIRGRELSVGLLKGQALEPVEITPKGEFYDYRHKYTRGATQYTCPAPLPQDLNAQLLREAEAVYAVCGCRDYARADFLYDPAQDTCFFLEINTLPGFTPLSLLPRAAQARGYSFEHLLDALIAPALERMQATRRQAVYV